jgi:chemotaxis protein MotA
MFISWFGVSGAGLSVLIGLFSVLFIRNDVQLLRNVWQTFPSIFWRDDFQFDATIHKLIGWNQLVRKSGLLALEKELEFENDSYLNLGIQFIVDGADEVKLRHSLSVVSAARARQWQQMVHLFEFLAKSSIWISLCFVLLGFANIQTTSTIINAKLLDLTPTLAVFGYGVGLSCFFFYPLSARMAIKKEQLSLFDAMALDGFIAINEHENARLMAHRLREYLGKKS